MYRLPLAVLVLGLSACVPTQRDLICEDIVQWGTADCGTDFFETEEDCVASDCDMGGLGDLADYVSCASECSPDDTGDDGCELTAAAESCLE